MKSPRSSSRRPPPKLRASFSAAGTTPLAMGGPVPNSPGHFSIPPTAEMIRCWKDAWGHIVLREQLDEFFEWLVGHEKLFSHWEQLQQVREALEWLGVGEMATYEVPAQLSQRGGLLIFAQTDLEIFWVLYAQRPVEH